MGGRPSCRASTLCAFQRPSLTLGTLARSAVAVRSEECVSQALVSLSLELRACRQVALQAHRVPNQAGELLEDLRLHRLVGGGGVGQLRVLSLLRPPGVLQGLRLVLLLVVVPRAVQGLLVLGLLLPQRKHLPLPRIDFYPHLLELLEPLLHRGPSEEPLLHGSQDILLHALGQLLLHLDQVLHLAPPADGVELAHRVHVTVVPKVVHAREVAGEDLLARRHESLVRELQAPDVLLHQPDVRRELLRFLLHERLPRPRRREARIHQARKVIRELLPLLLLQLPEEGTDPRRASRLGWRARHDDD
mmetsp:Transcript_13765/g.38853  ORF Transcript_13765/g.38853 Transcript_13765/m.38853 type:complete len:304 (+) Transcript_13765:2863-3774(+)